MKTHVRILGFPQRSGYGDVDGVEIPDAEKSWWHEISRLPLAAEDIGGNVLYIRFAAAQSGDFGFLHVDSVTEKPASRIPPRAAALHLRAR